MTSVVGDQTIIAIDPNSRGVAFVVFEGGTLLDWGTGGEGGKEEALLDRLFARYNPDVLVIEDLHAPRCARRPRMHLLVQTIVQRAETRGTAIVAVGRHEVRRAWSVRGRRNKYAVASEIAAMFPEVEPLVPRPRKVYRSEAVRMDIFDAMSLALHAFPALRNAPG